MTFNVHLVKSVSSFARSSHISPEEALEVCNALRNKGPPISLHFGIKKLFYHVNCAQDYIYINIYWGGLLGRTIGHIYIYTW